MKSAIYDSNVISLLAAKEVQGRDKRVIAFYNDCLARHSVVITAKIELELRKMLRRSGKQRLFSLCQEFLAEYNEETIAWTPEMQTLYESASLREVFAGSRRSDNIDRRIAAAAVVMKMPVISNDYEFWERAKRIDGLEVISWHGVPKRGVATQKRGRKGRR